MHVPKQQFRAAMVAGALASLAACGDRRAADRAAADSALTHDLTLASAPTAQPTFQDTAIAPAPAAATRPTREPPAPAPVRRRVAPQPRVESPQPVPQQKLPSQPAPQSVETAAPAAAPARGEIGAGAGFALTSGSKVCTYTTRSLPSWLTLIFSASSDIFPPLIIFLPLVRRFQQSPSNR